MGVIFIDFRKAFDTVDHVVLDKKLQSSGIAGDLAEWMHDYMHCRKQQTQIGEAMSNFQQITYGVPQGSLLGPRLFSIYTRDLPGAVRSGHIQMYADDTTAYVIQDSVDDVCIALQRTLNEIQEWCRKHKLTVHQEKTKAMILNRQKFTGPLPQLKNEEQNIEYADECECLGILVDNKLNWKPQAKKISKAFGAKVKKIRTINYLPKKFLEEICFKTIIPAVLYTILVWGNCPPPPKHVERN